TFNIALKSGAEGVASKMRRHKPIGASIAIGGMKDGLPSLARQSWRFKVTSASIRRQGSYCRRRSSRGLTCLASSSPKSFLAAETFPETSPPSFRRRMMEGGTGADDALYWILDA